MSTNNRKVSRAAGTVGSMTMMSRLFGFVRDTLIAMNFGASPAADAFFVAFRIPNIQRRVLGEGAVSSAFIPVFSEYRSTQTDEETWGLASNLFNIFLFLLIVSSLFLVVFAPWIVKLFAPGFIDEPEKFQLTVVLTQWMAPFLLFVGLASFFSGILNTFNIFGLPAGAPIIVNVAMIVAVLYWSPMLDEPIMGLAYGVCIGGFLQWIVQTPRTFRQGFRLSFLFNWRDPGVVRMGRLLIPVLLGLAVYEVNLLVDTLIASLLEGGSISYLYYANRLVQLPLGVFGVAISVALLPLLSEQAAKKEWGQLRDTLGFGIRWILFVTIPATVGLILCRVPIINTLWERGEFTAEVTDGTAFALFFYAIGLCAFAGPKVVITAFYSMQDTKTPMKVGVWAMLLNIVLNIALMGPLKHGGLALATSLASIFNVVALLYLLKKRLGRLGGRQILNTTARISLSTAIMGGVVYAINANLFDRTAGLTPKLLVLTAAIVAGVSVYSLVTHLLKMDELREVLNLRKRKVSAPPEAGAD